MIRLGGSKFKPICSDLKVRKLENYDDKQLTKREKRIISKGMRSKKSFVVLELTIYWSTVHVNIIFFFYKSEFFINLKASVTFVKNYFNGLICLQLSTKYSKQVTTGTLR